MARDLNCKLTLLFLLSFDNLSPAFDLIFSSPSLFFSLNTNACSGKMHPDSRHPNDTLSLNSFNKTPSKGGFLLGTTASSTADPICDQQQQRVQVYYPSVYYTTGGEQIIRSAGGFLQESNLSSSSPLVPNVTTAEYGFSCVDPGSNTCIMTTRKPSSGSTRQHVYDIPHRFKKEPTAVCLMSQSSTVCFVPVHTLSHSCHAGSPCLFFLTKNVMR